MTKKPLVSIIIVNYNGQLYLEKCLESIGKSNPFNFEIVVVDNGSSQFNETPLNPLVPLYPLKVIRLPKNLGPALARNLGAQKAQGKYLAFLDNDTEVEKNWLANAVEILEKDQTIGALQCKLLLNKDRTRFDYAGDYLTQWGFLTQVITANTKDKNQVPEGLEILAAKSAGMFIRADTFFKIGGFDKDYFIFMEETDLCWRVWLTGKRVVFTNQSVVYHEFGTTTLIDPKLQGVNSKFHGTKNYIATLIKNLETKNLIRILPLHFGIWFGLCGFMLVRGQAKNSFLVLKGILYNFLTLPKLLEKRKTVQSRRQVSDCELFPKIYRPVPFSHFYKKLVLAKPLGNAKPFFTKFRKKSFLEQCLDTWRHPAVALYRASELYHTTKVLERLKLRLPSPLLDLGCGDGKVLDLQFRQSRETQETQVTYWGLENTPHWVEKARESRLYQKVFLGDARKIPLGAQSVGTVYSNSVLEHIPEVEKVFSEVHRILKKGGVFIFTVNSENFAGNLFFSKIMPPYGKWRSKTIGITNNLANNEWEQMAKEAGFTIANKSQSITPKLTKLYDFLALATKVPGSSTLLRLIAKPNTGYTEPAEKNGSDLLIVLKKL